MMGGAGADGDANPMAAMLKAMAGGAGGEEGGMGDNSDLQARRCSGNGRIWERCEKEWEAVAPCSRLLAPLMTSLMTPAEAR